MPRPVPDRVLVALTAFADTTGNLNWVVSVDSTIVRVHQHGAYSRRGGRNAADRDDELWAGRSRDRPVSGQIDHEAHLATDGNGRGLAMLVTAGQTGESPMMPAVLRAVVPRLFGGPPRRSPNRVLADMA